MCRRLDYCTGIILLLLTCAFVLELNFESGLSSTLCNNNEPTKLLSGGLYLRRLIFQSFPRIRGRLKDSGNTGTFWLVFYDFTDLDHLNRASTQGTMCLRPLEGLTDQWCYQSGVD